MPKFMKNRAIELLDGGLESYLLAIYGLTLPNMRVRKHQESKYAPVMGLFGASTELIIKACLVQENNIDAMYKNNDSKSGIYKFGSEVLKEFKNDITHHSEKVSFLWKNPDEHGEQQNRLINYLDKFRLLQELRAQGLHAGIGCSRDIAVSTANDVYSFIMLLSQGKKLKAYIKNIPAPEETIKDREALIEDLSRRLNSKKNLDDKIGCLRNMYLVLPYIPDMAPDWIDQFEELTAVPPTVDGVNYLIKTLSDAHSIYLLKSRGGKEGVPVKIEPNNPDAFPVGVQYIKRTLSTIPDQFNNDILTANTRLQQNRLDLPIDDFLIDLFALGLQQSGVLIEKEKLTAQQVWPFVVSAYSTQGTPRPCMEFIKNCDELKKLQRYLEKAKSIGGGYYKRRADSIIQLIGAIDSGKKTSFDSAKDKIFTEIRPFIELTTQRIAQNPFTPQFIRKANFSPETSEALGKYIDGSMTAGSTLEEILRQGNGDFDSGDKKAITQLIKLCNTYDDRNALVAILRNDSLKGYASQARKKMFLIDFAHYYGDIVM